VIWYGCGCCREQQHCSPPGSTILGALPVPYQRVSRPLMAVCCSSAVPLNGVDDERVCGWGIPDRSGPKPGPVNQTSTDRVSESLGGFFWRGGLQAFLVGYLSGNPASCCNIIMTLTSCFVSAPTHAVLLPCGLSLAHFLACRDNAHVVWPLRSCRPSNTCLAGHWAGAAVLHNNHTVASGEWGLISHAAAFLNGMRQALWLPG
jgi:hypothetical protein